MRRISALPASAPYRQMIESFERDMLVRALDAAGQNVKITASRLGVSRKYLYDRFKALGVKPKRPGDDLIEPPQPTTLTEMFQRTPA